MRGELDIGHLHLEAKEQGAHVLVTVRGYGQPGSRPLLGTLMMTGTEWSSVEVLFEMLELANRQRLADLAEINRIQVQRDAARASLNAADTRLEQLQPFVSVLRDWCWQGIVGDGFINTDAMEMLAKAAAAVEAAEEKAREEAARE